MSDGPALLQAILAAPDDDAPRLIYADWCDEHGRSARAAFIRWQVATPAPVELLRLPHTDGKFYWAYAREAPGPQAYAACQDTLPPLAAHGAITFTRGFASEILCAAADWLAHGDALRAAHPITRVRLTTAPRSADNGQLFSRRCVWLVGREWSQWRATGEHVSGDRPRWGIRRRWDVREDAGGPLETVAEALVRAEWPDIEFEFPPEPAGGFHVPPEFAQALLQAAESGEPIIGDPVTIMFPNPAVPAPLGVIEAAPIDTADASPAPPDNARRRPGHSRMPSWLAERRQRPKRARR